MLKVCVSILNWHSAALTIRCLQSLDNLDQSHDAELQIIVVDNASLDDSIARIQTAYPAAKVIRAPENLGYAGGHRLAVEVARAWNADAIWLLNPDVTVHPQALIALVDAYHQFGLAVYGSVPLLAEDATRIGIHAWAVDGQGRLLVDELVLRGGQSYTETFPDAIPVRVANVSGCSIFIPFKVIEQFGFMHDYFFMYAEELDYCFRLNQQGVPVYVVPTSLVTHQLGGTFAGIDRVKPVLEYYQVRNYLVRIRRYSGWRRFFQEAREQFVCASCWRIWLRRMVVLWKPQPRSSGYYRCLGIRDALVNRLGRPFDPNDYVEFTSHED
jgi:GT2 family glycosyltransferase